VERGGRLSTHLVPDLDGDLLWALVRVEELLLTLAAAESDPRRPLRLPPVVSGGRALEALGRVHAALLPTQNGEGAVAPAPGDAAGAAGRRPVWLGADGRRLRPLGLAEVEPADLTVLSRTATSLGYELALRPDGGLARALVSAAREAGDQPGEAPTAVELVESLARVLGLLDLVDTDDTALLVRRMRDTAAGSADLELTSEEEGAHRRTLERMTGMWGSIPG
jgi:hypothetical protein